MPPTKNPNFRATYRLQLRKEFTLQQAAAITDYLNELGVSHVYLSPILESREGSNHGYDGTDPTKISVERGGEKGWKQLVAAVKKQKGLEGFILDIVPNHLAAHPSNVAWWDVLLWGPESKYWKTFDFRQRREKDYRITLPVLGKPRQAVLASREIKIDIRNKNDIVIRYFDNCYPVSVRSYPWIIAAVVSHLPKGSALQAKIENGFAAENLSKLTPSELKNLKHVLENISLKQLEEILNQQNYSLKDWRKGTQELNYRRFFDINDLAGLRIEDPEVFKWAHSKIKELVDTEPLVQGLRVDHVDGLTFPKNYLENLNEICPKIWVEKILGEGEKLSPLWPVTGSTGYEFTNISARLFIDLSGLLHLHAHYRRHIDDRWDRFHDCVYDAKREMLETHFSSELNLMTDLFYRQAFKEKVSFLREDLQDVLIELTSSLAIYRTYAVQGSPIESPYLEQALAETESRGRIFAKEAFTWLRDFLHKPGDWDDDAFRTIKRWEQLTGPVMAKGLEDTAIYRYCPLLSLNGVGGEPDWVGDGLLEFHSFSQDRLRTHPESMSTTSTHDTKRSEDVRSRIHVLSEYAEDWANFITRWKKMRTQFASGINLKDEHFIFETLLGCWPMDGKLTPEFLQRMNQYFMKAAREAKTESSWDEPNLAYEAAMGTFLKRVLFPKDPKGKKLFKELKDFADKCAYFGAYNSLSTLALKVLTPGLPDFYQGCELWDLSMVDPDNRRPVDYAKRRKYLKEMQQALKKQPKAYLKKILKNWRTGEVKLWLTNQLLNLRNQDLELFRSGEYLPLEPKGAGKSHFISFLRHHEGRWLFAAAPRFLPRVERVKDGLEITSRIPLGVQFQMPPQAPTKWKSVLTGETIEGSMFTAENILEGLPLGLWIASE